MTDVTTKRPVSVDLLFARDIEQVVTMRDVERLEKLSVMLRTLRGASDHRVATSSPGVAHPPPRAL